MCCTKQKHMKPIATWLLAAAFFVPATACNNQETETRQEAEKTTVKPKPGETKKTEVSVGPDGAEVKTKDGTEVKVSESGSSVGTKDTRVKITTKDTTKK